MTSSLIGDVSSHCLGRSSGRPFVYGPSLTCPQRVSQVSMGTMVCFLANASISPQPGSGNLAAGEGSEAYQSTWALLALPSRVFLCWRPRQGANLQPSASKGDAVTIWSISYGRYDSSSFCMTIPLVG